MKKLKVLLASTVLAASALTGSSVAQDNTDLSDFIKSYRVETNDCLGGGCGSFSLLGREAVEDFLAKARSEGFGAANIGNSEAASGTVVAPRGPQVVYLDFDAGGPTFTVFNADGTPFGAGAFESFDYTPEIRDQIQASLEADYAEFNFEFTQELPEAGEFTTLTFTCQAAAAAPIPANNCITVTAAGGVSILFGQAEGIDFRNLNMSDNAFLQGDFWTFLGQLDPSGGILSAFTGVNVTPDNLDAAVTSFTVTQAANTAAHELGHILGLRHHESFGAIGDGLPTTGQPDPNSFIPVFDGPTQASETILHTMASGASAGLSLAGSATADRFFSERSSIKLETAEAGRLINEADLEGNPNLDGAYPIRLRRLRAPNTILVGENAGRNLLIGSTVVQGNISESGEVDRYYFRTPRGLTFLNAEAISFSASGIANPIIGALRVFFVERNGNLTEIAANTQIFEPFDPLVLDLQLPERGTYMVEVTAPNIVFFEFDPTNPGLDPFPLDETGNGALRVGDYELLLYVTGGSLRGAPIVPTVTELE
jgi:hypothetical protein